MENFIFCAVIYKGLTALGISAKSCIMIFFKDMITSQRNKLLLFVAINFSFWELFMSHFLNDYVGGWSNWSEWSGWGKGLCAGNQRVKIRTCTNPLPDVSTGDFCEGENAVVEQGPGK